MKKKILVPLDGSICSEAILPCVEELAKTENAELVILRVPIIPAGWLFRKDTPMSIAISSDIELQTRRYLEVKSRAIEKEGIQVESMMCDGPVAKTIVEVAEEIHANMIAMSTHGYSGLKRWLKGSVAEEVVRLTHIPVILLHPS